MINKVNRILLFVLLLSGPLLAQRFNETQQLALPDSVVITQAEWVDMDNDGLLDILLIAENSAGQYFYSFKNDTVSGFSFMRAQSTGFTEAVYQIHDYDGDNRMDVAVTGMRSSLPLTSILKNLGGFQFQEIPLNLEIQATAMQFADFNNDGKRELILSGENSAGPFLNIYTLLDNTWEVVNDSLKIKATTILPFDIDGDLFTDLVISGVDDTGAAYLTIQFTNGDFKFTRTISFPDPVKGTIEIADISDDGWFDLLIGGTNDNGVYKTYRVLNLHTTFPVDETTLQLEKPGLFLADSDIDGIVDYSLLGYDVNDTINVIQQSGSPEDVLPHKGLNHQRFGDLEKDGDLDFFRLSTRAYRH